MTMGFGSDKIDESGNHLSWIRYAAIHNFTGIFHNTRRLNGGAGRVVWATRVRIRPRTRSPPHLSATYSLYNLFDRL